MSRSCAGSLTASSPGLKHYDLDKHDRWTSVMGEIGTGADVVATSFRSLGIDRVIGNPGTTELPLLRAMRDAGITYHLALHEDVATGIAYGMGWTTGRAHVAQVHAAPGLAHGLGNVYNALRSRVPMVVIAGVQDRRYGVHEPILWGPVDQMAAGWFKWSYEVGGVAEIADALTRAVATAEAHPRGPVFISLPYDVLVAEAEDAFVPRRRAVRGVRESAERPGPGPGHSSIIDAADMLSSATSPVIVVGDGLRGPEATTAIEGIAGQLQAPIYWEPLPVRNPISTKARWFKGSIGVSAHRIHQRLQKHDVLLAVGAPKLVPTLYSAECTPVPENIRIVDVSETEQELSDSCVADVAVTGPYPAVLTVIREALDHRGLRSEPAATEGLDASTPPAGARTREEKHGPMTPAAVVEAMATTLPRHTVIVDEALSSSGALLRSYPFVVHDTYAGNKGGGIGLGIPAAIGVALARDDRTSVVYTGDGSAMYTIQALWTAAQLELKLVVIVCNNHGYSILKAGMAAEGSEPQPEGEPEFDIARPHLDLCQLAEGMGVTAVRPSTAQDLAAELESALRRDGPTLLDVAVVSSTTSPQH